MALRREALACIRPMREADLGRVSGIESATFPSPWPYESLEYEFARNPFCASFVAESEGRVVGYAFLWLIYEQAHLINVAVDEACRGRGFGEALLFHVMSYARQNGAEHIHLEVRENNVPAIALYERYGFKRLGRGENYYSDGTAAIFMEAVLSRLAPDIHPV